MRHVVHLLTGLLVLAGLVGLLYFKWPWYSILVMAFAGVALNYWGERLTSIHQRDKARRLTAGRQAFTSEYFASSFFPAELVATALIVHRVFADIEGIDWTRVYADDHLIQDLAVNEADLMFRLYELHEEFHVQLPKDAIHDLTTFRKIVDWISQKNTQANDVTGANSR